MSDPTTSFDLARALARAAQAIGAADTLEGTLQAIADAARSSNPGFDHVGISVLEQDGSVTTTTATSQLVRELEDLQHAVGQGPSCDALRLGTLVMTDDLSEQRWPRYSPRALEAGVLAQLAVRLETAGEVLGTLSLYSTTGPLDPSAARHAELFAAHAALALGHARHADLDDEAVPERQLVGMAVGILMERFEIPHERALYYLVQVASTGHLELREVAREVVSQVTVRASAANGQPSA
jgi:GAF domain-containing protein